MPRYFFDTDDGACHDRDSEGIEMASPEDARCMAQAALPELAHECLPNGERQDFTVVVRDESDAVIYSASLELKGQWHR